jgi:hypothetical protein
VVTTKVDLGVYVRGYERARRRFSEAGDEWELGYGALLETVAWAGWLRERHKGRSPELDGLWFVRNLLLHVGGDALVQAITIHGTVLGTWVLGAGVLGMGDVHEWRWRPRAELSETDSDAGTRAYDKYLAGRAIEGTLEKVSRYLASLT